MGRRRSLPLATAIALAVALFGWQAATAAASVSVTLTPVKGNVITDTLNSFWYATAQHGSGSGSSGKSFGNYHASFFKPVDATSAALTAALAKNKPFAELRIDLLISSGDNQRVQSSVCFYDVMLTSHALAQSFNGDAALNERFDFDYVTMATGSGSAGCKPANAKSIPALSARILAKDSRGVTVGVACFASVCHQQLKLVGGPAACVAAAGSGACRQLGGVSVDLKGGAHERLRIPVASNKRRALRRLKASALSLVELFGRHRAVVQSPAIVGLPNQSPSGSISLTCPGTGTQGGALSLTGALTPAEQSPVLIAVTAPDGTQTTTLTSAAADGSFGAGVQVAQAGTYRFTATAPGGANGHAVTSPPCESAVSPPLLALNCPSLPGNNSPIPGTVPFSGLLAPNLGGSVTMSFTHNGLPDHQDTAALDAAGNWNDSLALTNAGLQNGSWSAVATYPAGSPSPIATSNTCSFTAG